MRRSPRPLRAGHRNAVSVHASEEAESERETGGENEKSMGATDGRAAAPARSFPSLSLTQTPTSSHHTPFPFLRSSQPLRLDIKVRIFKKEKDRIVFLFRLFSLSSLFNAFARSPIKILSSFLLLFSSLLNSTHARTEALLPAD